MTLKMLYIRVVYKRSHEQKVCTRPSVGSNAITD